VLVSLRLVEREEAVSAWLQFGPAASADDGYHDITMPPIELLAGAVEGGGEPEPEPEPEPEQSPIPVPLSAWAFCLLIVLLLLSASRNRRIRHV
jgi:hypothetical protein